MKKLHCVIVFFVLLLNFPGLILSWDGSLVFKDDFTSKYLRMDLWEYDDNCFGKVTRTDTTECFHRNKNILIDNNGTLTLTARIVTESEQKRRNSPYISTKIRTHSSGFKYGTFVIRARMPKGKHLFPSIWLQPINQNLNPCKHEEINLVEYRGQRTSTLIYSAVHGTTFNESRVRKYEKVFQKIDFSQNYHEFGLRWLPTKLQWLVDGKRVYELTTHFKSDWTPGSNEKSSGGQKRREYCSEDEDKGKRPFSGEMNLIIGLGIGGQSFPKTKYGELTKSEAMEWQKPTLEIDYVHIYQD